jgi:predicted nucleic acid-binding protein
MPVERIENLPAGTRLFLDGNIFIYAFGRQSQQCLDLLSRCAREVVYGITALELINEATRVWD